MSEIIIDPLHVTSLGAHGSLHWRTTGDVFYSSGVARGVHRGYLSPLFPQKTRVNQINRDFLP